MQNTEYLKNVCSFKEFIKLKEHIEQMTALEMAAHLDHEQEMKKINKK